MGRQSHLFKALSQHRPKIKQDRSPCVKDPSTRVLTCVHCMPDIQQASNNCIAHLWNEPNLHYLLCMC